MADPEHNVRYKHKGVSISVEQLDGFEKNPGLWIGTESPNTRVKVASFGSEFQARLFIKWLDYIIGATNDEGSMKLDAAD